MSRILTSEEFFGEKKPEKKSDKLSKVSNVFDMIFGGGKIGEQIGSGIERSVFRSKGSRQLEEAEKKGLVPRGTTMQNSEGPGLKELGADIAGTALTAVTGGSIGAASAGVKAASRTGRVLQGADRVLGGTNLARRVAGEAITGAGIGATQAIKEGQNVGSAALLGGAIGGGIPLGGRLLSRGAKAVGDVATGVLGITTGAKQGSIVQAIRAGQTNSPEFLDALRGKTGAMDIVGEAQTALKRAKETRSRKYISQFNKIAEADSQVLESIEPIKQNLMGKLGDFGVRVGDEGLDFSRSSFRGDDVSIKQIENIVGILDEWGNEAGDLTGLGLDTLKRVVGDITAANDSTKNIIDSTYRQVRQELVDKVPGYEKLVNDYEQISNLVDDVNRTLSLGGQDDTALKKLTSALRDNNDFRQALVQDLSEQGGRDLNAMIAGQQLSEITPRGLMSIVAAAIGGGAIFSGGIGALFSPAILPLVATGSPRVVGEFMRAIGIADSAIKPLTNAIKGIYEASEILLEQAAIRSTQEAE